ncbi:MAG: hypothetical protein AAF957_08605, partial [Planctomycetota bacterium]
MHQARTFLTILLALSFIAGPAITQDRGAELEQVFQPPRPVASTGYGGNVVSSGSWLAVFSFGETGPRAPQTFPRGAVHLYRWTGQSWTFAHSIWSPVTAVGQVNSDGLSFGRGIAFAGSSLFVSDPNQRTMGDLRGAVHRYELVGERWQWREELTSPTNEPGRFGWSMAAHGDRLFVGAPTAAPTATTLPGAVHVLESSAQAGWAVVDTLRVESSITPADSIAVSLAATEDQVVVSLDPSRHGVAVFSRGLGGWALSQLIEVRPTVPVPSNFGSSFSCDGDTLVIGDERVLFGGIREYVDVYRRGASGWEFHQTIESRLEPGTEFGGTVSVLGRRIVVGARNALAPGGAFQSGRVIDYWRGASGQWVERGELSAGRLDQVDPAGTFGTFVQVLGASVAATDEIRALDGVTPGGALALFRVPVGERACAPQPSSPGAPGEMALAGPLDLLVLVARCDVSGVPPSAVTMVHVG